MAYKLFIRIDEFHNRFLVEYEASDILAMIRNMNCLHILLGCHDMPFLAGRDDPESDVEFDYDEHGYEECELGRWLATTGRKPPGI